MKTRALVLLCAIAAALCVSIPSASGKTAGCPCSPCKCSPCTCGGGGSKGGKHHDHHGHDRDSSFGVGGTVDLGGIGHRKSEPDPFAAGGGDKPVAHTQEKHKTSRKEHEPTITGTFDEIKLTGVEGKGDIPPPSDIINVSDEVEQPPLPQTETKAKSAKLSNDALDALNEKKWAYQKGLFAYEDKFTVDLKAMREELRTLEKKAPEFKKKVKEYNKLLDKIENGFAKSDEGKKLFNDWLKTYEKFYKPGQKMPPKLVPTTSHPFSKPYNEGDEIANKKADVESGQAMLDAENKKYNELKDNAVANDDNVKKAQTEVDKMHGYTNNPTNLDTHLEETKKQAVKDWATTKEANDQMKKIQQAEQDLNKAKEAFKPFEQLTEEKPKAASNP